MVRVWERITRFFAWEGEKILLWLLLGPTFLLLSLFLASSYLPSYHEFWFIVLAGLFLLWKFPRIGLIGALSLLVLASLWKHRSLTGHSWQIGLESSLALGLIITGSSLKRWGSYVGSLQERLIGQEKNYASLALKAKEREECLEKEREDLQTAVAKLQGEQVKMGTAHSSLSELVLVLQGTLDELGLEKETLLKEIREKSYALLRVKEEFEIQQVEKASLKDEESLKKKNDALQEELNQTRVDKYQANLINENLALLLSKETVKLRDASNMLEKTGSERRALEESLKEKTLYLEELSKALAEEKQRGSTQVLAEAGTLKREVLSLKEKLEEKKLLLKMYEEKFDEARKLESSYLQLRKQFEEKGELLHQTRGELFRVETRALAFEREKGLSLLEEKEEWVQILPLLRELEEREKEREELLQIVTHLMQEGLPKSQKRKKSSSSGDQLRLM